MAGIPDYIGLNTRQPPFDNDKVRQAVALAINRADIRNVAYLGTGEPGLTEMPTGSSWYDAEGLFAPKQDIAKAKGTPEGSRLCRTVFRSNISVCRNIRNC